MKVLVLNGSPHKKGNTMCLTDAFVQGMRDAVQDLECEVISVYEKKIAPCRGCFGCWINKEHACVQKDDMEEVLQAYRSSDVIIWSFPLYYFGLPGALKTVMDRMLPFADGHIDVRQDGTMQHPLHEEMHQRMVVLSSCGFGNLNRNYEAVTAQYNIMCGVDTYSHIYCGEGGVLRLSIEPVKKYLALVRQAGEAYVRTGAIPSALMTELEQNIVPIEEYLAPTNQAFDHAGK